MFVGGCFFALLNGCIVWVASRAIISNGGGLGWQLLVDRKFVYFATVLLIAVDLAIKYVPLSMADKQLWFSIGAILALTQVFVGSLRRGRKG